MKTALINVESPLSFTVIIENSSVGEARKDMRFFCEFLKNQGDTLLVKIEALEILTSRVKGLFTMPSNDEDGAFSGRSVSRMFLKAFGYDAHIQESNTQKGFDPSQVLKTGLDIPA